MSAKDLTRAVDIVSPGKCLINRVSHIAGLDGRIGRCCLSLRRSVGERAQKTSDGITYNADSEEYKLGVCERVSRSKNREDIRKDYLRF